MYQTPAYSDIKAIIMQEYVNQTGILPPRDSDADVRASGTAAVAEGLYSHQEYILKQLFVQTADEPYLYIHSEELGLPRLDGSTATGQVLASGTTDGIVLPIGSKLTDGYGRYWQTTSSATLSAVQPVSVSVQATQTGAAYNATGTLLWVSPVSGLQSVAQVDVISGGSDGESLERWRGRLWNKKKLGKSLSRTEDLRQAVLSVAGVANAYVYPLRRGAGSIDVAITAQGANGATLPSDSLLAQSEQVLKDSTAFWEDVRTFKPTIVPMDVTAKLTGVNVNTGEISAIINDYLNALTPAESYKAAVLYSLIMAVPNMIDVQLTPNVNVNPTISMEQVGWIRPANITVTL
ncbi:MULTISPECIES: baseplate J/gp47 family protein [unclassified Psychrobacter]|uniref:baseplate J/gp47 family protein n=1 Tax=unclassified Psychrobacter TaxID=196806 RepID=UPI0018F2E05B|nr:MULTISPECIES: baseplate J/gp47 family protein [unclassified Psychrobacter]